MELSGHTQNTKSTSVSNPSDNIAPILNGDGLLTHLMETYIPWDISSGINAASLQE